MSDYFDGDINAHPDERQTPRGDVASTSAITVSELNGHLKAVVEGTFPPMWVCGEVTDVAKPRSGHLYFTLKDDDSQVRGVMWRSVASRLGFDLENGQSILCFGSLEVYTVRGSYQLVVKKAQPQGIGTLQQAFEKLRAKLNAEGLFDAERKRPIPRIPQRVAIVTSPSGAAVHDFLVAAKERMLGAEIFVIPAQVQGDGAAATIRRGLRAAALIRPELDVVVVARGGGSLEDLWCFNEEAVVRSIAECPIPTVSAIGHEVDVTLADLAADVRALTPTDAATRVFSDRAGIIGRVNELSGRLNRAIDRQIESRRMRLQALQSHPALTKPFDLVHLRSREVDELELRAQKAVQRQLEQATSDVRAAAASLAALSPLNTLARGYSVTLDEDGKTVQDASELSVGQTIRTTLQTGRFRATVDEIAGDE